MVAPTSKLNVFPRFWNTFWTWAWSVYVPELIVKIWASMLYSPLLGAVWRISARTSTPLAAVESESSRMPASEEAEVSEPPTIVPWMVMVQGANCALTPQVVFVARWAMVGLAALAHTAGCPRTGSDDVKFRFEFVYAVDG